MSVRTKLMGEFKDPKEDSQETIDAFVIVMGMSFFPLLFAAAGLLLIQMGIIRVEDYNAEATTVKGMGRGLFVVTWFGIAGLCIPIMYALYVLQRTISRNYHKRCEQQ